MDSCDQYQYIQLKAGIHYTTLAQISAMIYSLNKLMLIVKSQRHSANLS